MKGLMPFFSPLAVEKFRLPSLFSRPDQVVSRIRKYDPATKGPGKNVPAAVPFP